LPSSKATYCVIALELASLRRAKRAGRTDDRQV
jgi:hypothetical protein